MQRFDFPPALFPITFEALHPDTRAVVWSHIVEYPDDPVLVEIPPLRKRFGHRVAMRIRFGDGTFSEEEKESR